MKSAYALSWLDRLITTESWNGAANSGKSSCAEAASLRETLQKQKGAVRSMLMHQVFGMKDERMLEALIQQYQSSLIRLLNRLDETKEKHPNAESGTIKEELSTALQELLQYIESYFSKYLDLDQQLPHAYRTRIQRQWKERLQQEASFIQSSVPAPVSKLVLPVLQDAAEASRLHYRQMIYLDHLLRAITARYDEQPHPVLCTPFIENLVYLNFNHPLFIAFLIGEIEAATASMLESQSVQEHLLACREMICSIRAKPGMAFREQLPSVQTAVKEWIDYQLQPTPDLMMHPPKEAARDKVHLSVSVAMLGLFVRLLHEEGIITTRNQAEIIRFFAGHFATPRQSEISSDSLYGSYFKPQPGTTRMMQECLLRMQNTLRKKF